MTCNSILLGLFATLPLSLFAQEAPSPQDPLASAMAEWQDNHGADWVLRTNSRTGTARFLFGSKAAAPWLPVGDEAWFERGRQVLDEAFSLFQIADSTLVEDQVKFLTLSHIGSSDKIAVIFSQARLGIAVEKASVTVLFNQAGEVLAVDSTALPKVEDLAIQALADPFGAMFLASQEFTSLESRRATPSKSPELVIVPAQLGKITLPRLAYAVEIRDESDATDPAGRRIFIAADQSELEVLGQEQLIHHQDLSGNVQAWASPGTLPDLSLNPETLHVMSEMNITSSAGGTTSDGNGDFSIPYTGTTPVELTFGFSGPYARVLDSAGGEYSLKQTLSPGVPANIAMNPNKSGNETAEANAYRGILDFRTWLKSIDPTDTTMDFSVTANVNLSSTCNAYYNGSSINFYAQGGGCSNTAYSTVVAHEEGHWANDRYGSGNGSDGFGEGNADVFGMYIYDSPIVGEYFFTTGGFVRTGLNNRQFCGDSNTGCYGQVHADGEVLMGALWKVRAQLNTTLGNTAGDLVADTLFVAWMNSYNDGQIKTIIEDHWLTLDDDDGNISNGTPNYNEIDAGFRQQGFPGFDLPLIGLTHVPLGDQLDETGPYPVDATIVSLIGSSIASSTLYYSVDGGSEMSVAMSNVAASDWSAGIPGQISPAQVAYRIEAIDALGNKEQEPEDGGTHSFIVGLVTRIYSNDFDGSTDEGWTHAWTGNSSNSQDDWQRGSPTGQSGTSQTVSWQDPVGAYSGSNCWANDIGGSGWNGAYQNNIDNYLDSPIVDCSGQTGVRLRFARWLSSEQSQFDKAKILVNSNEVWINSNQGHHLDTGWNLVDLDISQYADNNAAVQIRFSLTTDSGMELGGWAIDDFELLTIDKVPGNKDTILLSGPTTATVGSTVTYNISAAPASNIYWLASAKNLNGSVIGGHTFDLGAPARIVAKGTTDANGAASVTSPPLSAALSGRTLYLEVAATDGTGLFDSNAIGLSIQ